MTKTIAGALAGQQGAIVIQPVCNGSALPEFVIPAGAPAGDQSRIYSDVPTPASCVVTETSNGQTSTVSAVVTGSPTTTTIPPGGAGAVQITDSYGPATGSLLVTKTIGGPLAGHQGSVTIQVACGGPLNDFAFPIPAHAAAGSVSRRFVGLPSGSRCTITETTDGHNHAVGAIASRRRQQVTIRANSTATARFSDIFAFRGPPSFTG